MYCLFHFLGNSLVQVRKSSLEESMLKSKRSIHHLKETASRQFTDREQPRQSFQNAVQSLSNDQYKILVFYGVGGIGKSRLLEELVSITSSLEELPIKVTIDFREPTHRDPSEALIWFRQQLTQEYNIKFTTFDLAYAVYWSRMKPQLALKSERKSIPFLEEGSFIGELVGQLENLPVVQWIPRTIKLIDGLAQYKDILHWWNRNGKQILSDLKEMHPKDIEDMLLVYWAADLNEWLKANNRKAVFFFDTYEALWEHDRSKGSFSDRDEWIREFILQFEDVPVLNIICGREKITWSNEEPEWEQVVEQHLIGELSPTDCISFLEACNIDDKNIQEIIIQGSSGLPYYLDLMVDTYQVVSKKKVPTIDDFSEMPSKVLKRFLKYLDRPEKETLTILSIPRFWTESLFVELVTEFKTYYPPTAFNELCQFSFIQEKDNSGVWSMHKLMKEGLYDQITQHLLIKVHSFLFQYYTGTLEKKEKSDVDNRSAFIEGLYHGEVILDEDQLVHWISTYATSLGNEGKWSTLIKEYERLLSSTPFQKKLPVFLNQQLGSLFALKGQYQLAEKHNLKAMELLKEEMTAGESETIFKSMAYIQQKLGELYRNTNQYDQSIEAYKNALHYLGKTTKNDQEILQETANTSTHLGKVYKLISCYDEAKSCYEFALEQCEKAISAGLGSSFIYAVYGEVHEKIGELEHETHGEIQDLTHFYKAIGAYNRALEDREMKNYIPILAKQGLAYKRLAEVLPMDTHIGEKLEYFRKAISRYKEVIQLAPNYVDSFEMLGHASVDLLDLYVDIQMYEEAIESFNLAVNSFEKAIGLSEKQGSSRNRLSSAYRSLGRLHRKKKNYALAIEVLEIALQKSDELFRYSPEYVYAHNSRGKIYIQLGNCYLEMGDAKRALNCFKSSASCFEKTLEKSPNSRAALTKIHKLNHLIQMLTEELSAVSD